MLGQFYSLFLNFFFLNDESCLHACDIFHYEDCSTLLGMHCTARGVERIWIYLVKRMHTTLFPVKLIILTHLITVIIRHMFDMVKHKAQEEVLETFKHHCVNAMNRCHRNFESAVTQQPERATLLKILSPK